MSRRRRMIVSSDKGTDVNQVTTLSLFIMLLAFFIVLNSKSNFEESRSKPVIRSIEKTFSSKVTGYEDKQPSAVEDLEQNTGQANAIESIDGLFKTEFPSFKQKLRQDDDLMSTTSKKLRFRNLMIQEASSVIRLRDILNRHINSGKPYIMEITFYFSQDPAKQAFDSPDIYRKNLRDAENYVQNLITLGFDPRGLALNFFKGDPSDITLTFRERPSGYRFVERSGGQ